MSRLAPIISILLLVALALGGYFFWWPKYQEFDEKRLELQGKDERIRQTEEHLSGLNTLSDRLVEYRDKTTKIDSALQTDPSVAALFDFLLKVSSENGLFLASHNLSTLYSLALSKERIQKMPFSISLSGSYPAFKNFLSAIYKNVRLFEVDSINFASPREETGGLFNFGLLLKTQAYKPGQGEAETFE